MDQKELQEKIALYFSKLTPKAQASFSSMLWLEILKGIADKYSLTAKQIETLSTETTLMLLGIIHTDEFEKALYDELGLPEEITAEIIAEIDSSILKGIRGELNDTYQKNTKELEGEQNKKYENKDERLKNLPKDIQDAVSKTDYHDSLYKIFEENKLNIEQMGILETAVMDMLSGTLRPEKFKDTIKSNLGFDDAKTQKIVNDVNEKILKEVKNQVLRANNPVKEDKINTEQEDMIMKKAGIEINRGGVEKPKIPTPNKLFDSVRVPVTHTDHSLMNLTRSVDSNQTKNNEKLLEITAPEQKITANGGTPLKAVAPTPPVVPTPAPTVIPKTPIPPKPISLNSSGEVVPPVVQKKTMDIKKPSLEVPPIAPKSDDQSVPNPKPASYLKNKDPYRLSPEE